MDSANAWQIEKLVHALIAARKRGARGSIHQLNELRARTAQGTSHSGTLGSAIYVSVNQAYALLENDRPSEALDSLHGAVSQSPNDLELQAEWQEFIQVSAVQALGLGAEHPHSPEFYRLYLKLLHLGEVPLRCHLGAIEYLRVAGQYSEAEGLANRLTEVAPNLRGLKVLRQFLAVRPHPQNTAQLKLNPSPLTHSTTDLLEHQTLKNYQAVVRAFQSNEYPTVLQLTQEPSLQTSLPKAQRDAFLYYRGAAMDATGNPLDALPIFLELIENYPANPRYHEALATIMESLSRQIAPIVQEQPNNPILIAYANMMKQADICPWWLFRASAKQRAASNNPAEREAVKADMNAHLLLSPQDPDYLQGAMEVAEVMRDPIWLDELAERAAALLRILPFSLKHQGLVGTVEKSELKNAS